MSSAALLAVLCACRLPFFAAAIHFVHHQLDIVHSITIAPHQVLFASLQSLMTRRPWMPTSLQKPKRRRLSVTPNLKLLQPPTIMHQMVSWTSR